MGSDYLDLIISQPARTNLVISILLVVSTLCIFEARINFQERDGITGTSVPYLYELCQHSAQPRAMEVNCARVRVRPVILSHSPQSTDKNLNTWNEFLTVCDESPMCLRVDIFERTSLRTDQHLLPCLCIYGSYRSPCKFSRGQISSVDLVSWLLIPIRDHTDEGTNEMGIKRP